MCLNRNSGRMDSFIASWLMASNLINLSVYLGFFYNLPVKFNMHVMCESLYHLLDFLGCLWLFWSVLSAFVTAVSWCIKKELTLYFFIRWFLVDLNVFSSVLAMGTRSQMAFNRAGSNLSAYWERHNSF